MQPYTKIFPKPLLPMGDDTVIDLIVSKFLRYRFNNFYVTTNYKHQVINNHFKKYKIKINCKIIKENKPENIEIKEGEIFLLPPLVPHSPQRFETTVGLVIERKRTADELDGFQWYCDNCHKLLYEEFIVLTDIVKQLPPIFKSFWENKDARICKYCSTYLEKP